GAVDLFEDVSGGPCHDRTVECLVVGVGREHEHAGVGEHGTDVPTDGDTITVGEPHVEYDHVGFEYRDAGHGLRGRSGLTDHLDAVLVVQEGTCPSSDDLVVVHQKPPERRGGSPPVRPPSTSVTRGRPGPPRSWLSVVGVLVAHTPERMNGYGTPQLGRPEGLHPTHQTKQHRDSQVGANVPFRLGHVSYRVVADWGPSPFDKGPTDN